MNIQPFSKHDSMFGFTLIELMVVVSIVGILVATSLPAYSIYIKRTRLLVAEISLTNKLKEFSVVREYSPASGMLADLVAEGFLKSIPNDPWTSMAKVVNTGAEEVIDWYYKNDGEQLYLYAKSHPGRLYILPSFGLPPLLKPLKNDKVKDGKKKDDKVKDGKKKDGKKKGDKVKDGKKKDGKKKDDKVKDGKKKDGKKKDDKVKDGKKKDGKDKKK